MQMSYTKNYYHVLGLATPHSRTTAAVDQEAVKKAYRSALLSAHPDTAAQAKPNSHKEEGAQEKGNGYTVDDVKEAFSVLGDKEERRRYDGWLFANPGVLSGNHGSNNSGEDIGEAVNVANAEILDLSDFEVGEFGWGRLGSASPESGAESPPGQARDEDQLDRGNMSDVDAHDAQDRPEGVRGAGPAEVEWTRSCRCGEERGFRIRESELEEAERRGDKEVLVGCVGCSLWVRVGFDVEDG